MAGNLERFSAAIPFPFFYRIAGIAAIHKGEGPLLGEAASVAAQIYALVHDAAESVRKEAENLQEGQSPVHYPWSDELTAKLELLSDEFPELCEEFWFRSLFGEITLRLYSFASDALEICVDPESGPEDSPELYSAWLSLYQRTEGLLKTFQYGDLL